jgi:hypothetical protein
VQKSSDNSRVFEKTGSCWRTDDLRPGRPVSARSNDNVEKAGVIGDAEQANNPLATG